MVSLSAPPNSFQVKAEGGSWALVDLLSSVSGLGLILVDAKTEGVLRLAHLESTACGLGAGIWSPTTALTFDLQLLGVLGQVT